MEIYGFIYKTTCLVNGKIYIGQTTNWKDCQYIGSGSLFQRALKKYGKDKFKRKILRICYSQKELNTWEYVFIKKYKSQDKSIGYNIADGDILSSERNPAKLPEVREKIRRAAIGRKRPMSEATKKKISKALKGKKVSEETKRKLSEAMKGKGKYWEGKKMPLSARKKMSASKKGKYTGENNPNFGNHVLAGSGNPMFGKKHTEEARRKMSEAQRRRFLQS